jgi:hypothetical protein
MKKYLLVILILSFLFIGQNVFAVDLLLDYPEIPGAETPGKTTSLPEMIKYIYMFAIGISGVTALLVILVGAVQYATSAGNPTKAGEAKDRIFSAILGILILLASVLILRTINPDLIILDISLPSLGGGSGEKMSFHTQCYFTDSMCSSGQVVYMGCTQAWIQDDRKKLQKECNKLCTDSFLIRNLYPNAGIIKCRIWDKESECQPQRQCITPK